MQNVIINGNTYEEVQKVQIPLSDGSGNADYVDTSGATATAENIDKGFNAYVNGELVIGTKGSEDLPLLKMGEYDVVTLTNTSDLEVAVVKDVLLDVTTNFKDELIDAISNQRYCHIMLLQELDKTNTSDQQFYFGVVTCRFDIYDSLISANTGHTYRLLFNASEQISSQSTGSFMGKSEFDESTGYVSGVDLVINQFDKFPSGKVTAYILKSPF